jgi:hypothetical protein
MEDYDIIYKDWAVPKSFKCDGCSIPQPFHKWFRAERWDNTGCRLHDFHRQYLIVSRKEADRILKEFVLAQDESWNYKVVAWLGYFIVRIARFWIKNKKPLPIEWKEFTKPMVGE